MIQTKLERGRGGGSLREHHGRSSNRCLLSQTPYPPEKTAASQAILKMLEPQFYNF